MRMFIIMLMFLTSCGKTSEKQPDDSPKTGELRAKYLEKIAEAEGLRNSATGWLTYSDGDSYLWDIGKYASSPMVTGVDVRASEFSERGRFGRRPPVGQTRCWTKEDGDICSPSTWSRDMGTALIAYAVRTGSLTLLEDHADYGESHNWYMGEPLADGRTLYTPSMVGLLYTAIYALGGADNAQRHLPTLWPSGLDDYEAHLQMMTILIRGNASKMLGFTFNEKGASLLDISDTMLERVKEHYGREPHSLFYSYLDALYNGGMASVVDKCLSDSPKYPSYVRCAKQPLCELSEWLFSCSLVLQAYNEL